jgi:hypothetical protein
MQHTLRFGGTIVQEDKCSYLKQKKKGINYKLLS